MNSNATTAPDLGGCIRLVRSLAWGLLPKLPDHFHFEDLYSEGLVGLSEALGRFDPGRGVLPTTYIYARARSAMLDYVNRECKGGFHRTCRLPEWLPARSPSPEHGAAVREEVEHVLDRMDALASRSREIIEGMVAEEEFKAVAERLGLTISNAHKLKRLARAELQRPGLPPSAEARFLPEAGPTPLGLPPINQSATTSSSTGTRSALTKWLSPTWW